MGGAAELGAELRLSEQVHVNADVRWVELASDASLLRASDGLVSADPVSVGISLGWRFR
jgi:outer membrane protein W